ncbi:hypothetical protein WICMUC_000041 [Wickerhamomyces mucosus]|uniref:Protein kinase domain-containing protein n=1 Tax=Wickerhamomyces mucosus TaxID=1378264 RepID=A0A9P8TIL0_9ASCO|nr:hypothetical protein WICMUC_000041 [Wickerhamomyces mucosus]
MNSDTGNFTVLKIFDPVRVATGKSLQYSDSKRKVNFDFSESFDFCLNVMLSREISAYMHLESKIDIPKLYQLIFFIPSAFALKKLAGGILPLTSKSENVFGGLALESEFIMERYRIPNTLEEVDEYFTTLVENAKRNLVKIHENFGLHRDIHSGNVLVTDERVVFIDFSYSLRILKEDLAKNFSGLKEEMIEEFENLKKVITEKLIKCCDEIRNNERESILEDSKFFQKSDIQKFVSEKIGEVYIDLEPDNFNLNSEGSDKADIFDFNA